MRKSGTRAGGASDQGTGRPTPRRRRALLLLLAVALLGSLALAGLAGAVTAPVPGAGGSPTAGAPGGERLVGNGSFGPLFEEPGSFIQPGRRLNTGPNPSPNERLIAQGPSKCVVVEGKNRTPAQKAADPENDGFINCKVPAASISVTPFKDRFVSWNAVDSTENNEAGIAFEYGVKSINDRTRSFRIKKGAAKGDGFSIPKPEDGGANPGGDPDTDPVVPPATDGNGQNDGSLFCADHTFLPDGRVIAVGGTNYLNDPGAPDNPGTPVREDAIGAIELQGVKSARAYDSRSDRWTQLDKMRKGRWYPSLVTLGNGALLSGSGVTKLLKPAYLPPRRDGLDPDESGRNVTSVETLSHPKAKWRENGNPRVNGPERDRAERSLPLFPRFHLLPNGKVFYNTGGQSFNPFGQAYDQNTWSLSASYDPESEKWKSLGVPGLTDTGPGGAPGAPLTDERGQPAFGFRGSTHSAMLPLKPGKDGKYTKAEFLTGGGLAAQPTPSPGSYFPTRSSRITTVQTNGDREKIMTRKAGPMKNRGADGGDQEDSTPGLQQPAPDAPPQTGRWYASVAVLPTGQVAAFGGADRDEVAFPGVEKTIREVEIFERSADNPSNPLPNDGDGAWRTAASSHKRRSYHNTSALLPDGRVLFGGLATISTGYARDTQVPPNQGQGPQDRGPNGHDPSMEIWTPPYDRSQGRLKIESAPRCSNNVRSINVDTDAAKGQVQSVVLARNTTQTHVVDPDQRTVELPFKESKGGSLQVDIPNGNVAPPGPYLLFVNKKSNNGKTPPPSIASQMFVGPSACRFTNGPGPGGGGGERCTNRGTDGNDILRGTQRRDVICAGAGNDVVYGLGGDDVLLGGDGRDVLRGGDGNDRLEGGAGNDQLIGGRGDDRAKGEAGNDDHVGQEGRDSLDARDGVERNDVVNGGPGGDACQADGGDPRTSC